MKDDNPGRSDDFKDRVTDDLVSLPPPNPFGSKVSISKNVTRA